MPKNELKVISASRRFDMVANNPSQFAEILQQKTPPEIVHTLVLWTKNPENIFVHSKLFNILKNYEQIFLHLTITGLGGTILEPFVPPPEKIINRLQDLINFVKNPKRMRIRFDPVVDFISKSGENYQNLHYFKKLAPLLKKHNMTFVSTSWVQIYDKVKKRLAQKNIQIVSKSDTQIMEEYNFLQDIAHRNGLILYSCCTPSLPISRCIDGYLYNDLHPKGYHITVEKAQSQRQRCGCTKSWDIGWYYKCKHGCLYCYGNPAVTT